MKPWRIENYGDRLVQPSNIFWITLYRDEILAEAIEWIPNKTTLSITCRGKEIRPQFNSDTRSKWVL